MRTSKFCPLLLLVARVVTYQQNDYILTSERGEVVGYDAQYITANISNFKYNRTCKAINATFFIKRNVGNALEVEIQGFRFASNEYRLFPITFKVNICDALRSNEFGLQNSFICGNFTGCPLRKGHYRFCNWIPDYEKFPPHIPSGDYMLELNITFSSKPAVQIQWYLKVEKILRFH